MSQQLSTGLPWEVANPLWATQLNTIIINPTNNSVIILNLKLTPGNNVINHGLGKTMIGWIIIDRNNAAVVYRVATAPLNALTLTLNTTQAVTINLEVF